MQLSFSLMRRLRRVVNAWGLTARLTVTPSGAAATETKSSILAGEHYIVTITDTKTRFVLGTLIPGFGSSNTLLVKTTMSGSHQPGGGKFSALAPPKLVQ